MLIIISANVAILDKFKKQPKEHLPVTGCEEWIAELLRYMGRDSGAATHRGHANVT